MHFCFCLCVIAEREELFLISRLQFTVFAATVNFFRLESRSLRQPVRPEVASQREQLYMASAAYPCSGDGLPTMLDSKLEMSERKDNRLQMCHHRLDAIYILY